MTDLERNIAEGLSRFADYPLADMRPQTRIWHDARVAGDDFLDFVEWFWRSFGVALPGAPGDYAPTESRLYRHFLWWPFRRRRSYRELTIADLARLAS